MENFKKTFGKKLQTQRKIAGYKTQESFAHAIDPELDRTRVSRWESGENFPDPVFRDKIIQILGVPKSFFDVTSTQPSDGKTSKSALIGDIVAVLPALNEDQLRNVFALVSGYSSGKSVDRADSDAI